MQSTLVSLLGRATTRSRMPEADPPGYAVSLSLLQRFSTEVNGVSAPLFPCSTPRWAVKCRASPRFRANASKILKTERLRDFKFLWYAGANSTLHCHEVQEACAEGSDGTASQIWDSAS